MARIDIKTEAGVCPSYVFKPSGNGPWPAVLVFMDGVGIRPAMLDVGERLAKHGYFVLLPDLFYRAGPYEPMNAKTVFTDPEQRKVLTEKFFAHVSPAGTMADTGSFLDWLGTQADVRKGGIGVTGYCMGGAMALRAAAAYPDAIAACAAYHPGRVATDAPDSPHLGVGKIKARVYVAGASDDPSFPEDMKTRFKAALTKAGVRHAMETYPAKHGWVLSDTPAYDEPSAERHYKTLVELLDAEVKR